MMIDDLLTQITQWAQQQTAIRAVLLVGSHARGTARPDSDIDVMCLTRSPDDFRSAAWITQIQWPSEHGTVAHWHDQTYGVVWSRHMRLTSGQEVELSFGALTWASVMPIDAGTHQVIRDGHHILYDPDGLLNTLINAMQLM